MKKIFNFALTAALVGGLSLSVTSCKSDEEVVDLITPSTVTIDNDLISHGIVTDMENTVVEVPVKCDGKWIAILAIDDEEDNEKDLWVKIQDWQGFYEGNQTLRLHFDDNMTGVDRATTLTIANSQGELQTVPVRQNYTWKGQAPTNSSAQAFQNKGVGYGIDYNYLLNLKGIRYRSSGDNASASIQNSMSEDGSVSFNPLMCKKSENIYHLSTIDKLCQAGAMGGDKDAYVEEPIEIANLKAQMLDSTMVVDGKLKIGLQVDANIGPVSFSIKGKYLDKRRQERNYVDYTIIRNAPMYDVMTSPASITTYAERNQSRDLTSTTNFIKLVRDTRADFILRNSFLSDKSVLGSDSLTNEQRKIIDGLFKKQLVRYSFGGVFSSHFEACLSKLYNHITLRLAGGLPVNSAQADRVCAELDDHYGPFIIAGAQVGGSMVIQLKLDTLRLDGEINVDGKANVEALVVEGYAEASYREKGFHRMRYYQPSIHIYGGDAHGTEEELLRIVYSDNPNDHETWITMLSGWLDSMKSKADEGDLSEAAPISFTAVPIWNFFFDTDMAAYVRSYFMNKYKTRKISDYLDIIDDVPDHKTFIELLNDFREDEPDGENVKFDQTAASEDDWELPGEGEDEEEEDWDFVD